MFNPRFKIIMKRFVKTAIILASVVMMTSSCGVMCAVHDVLMSFPPPPPYHHHHHHHHHHGHHHGHHHWCDVEELAPMNENLA